MYTGAGADFRPDWAVAVEPSRLRTLSGTALAQPALTPHFPGTGRHGRGRAIPGKIDDKYLENALKDLTDVVLV